VKIPIKLPKRDSRTAKTPSRITNETVAEHRERILAEGRRFKYPMQYARHRLVRNAIIIGVAVAALLLGLLWFQLYIAKSSGNVLYRFTRVLPVPVASVEGDLVRYSDFLLYYRSSMGVLNDKQPVDESTEDGARIVAYQRNEAMQLAVADRYVADIAKERDINVSDEQIDTVVEDQRGELSENAYYVVVQDRLHWDRAEYRAVTRKALLKQDVAFAIDETARDTKGQVEAKLREEVSLEQIANDLGDRVQFSDSGFVNKNNSDGGLARAAERLEKGAVSGVVRTSTGDGYYYVQHVDSNDNQIRYAYVKVPLTQLTKQLDELYASDKVEHFIDIQQPEAVNQQ